MRAGLGPAVKSMTRVLYMDPIERGSIAAFAEHCFLVDIEFNALGEVDVDGAMLITVSYLTTRATAMGAVCVT